jgi:hypothetical protein
MKQKVMWMLRFFPVLLVVSGCTAINPFPQAARSGDTVALAVGSQEGMTKLNTQVYFTPDSPPGSAPINITSGVRSIFSIFADPTSTAYSKTNTNSNLNFQYLHREQGQTVIALDLPTLPVGTGIINVTTSVPQPVPLENNPGLGAYPDLNSIDIPFEILSGTGTSNPFDYATTFGGTLTGNLLHLRPRHQALVKPPLSDFSSNWANTFGAIELVMDLPMVDDGGTVTEDSIRVVAQNLDNFTDSRAQMTWSYDGTDLKVIFISATGKLQYYEPRFAVVGETADFTTTPVISSVNYYDVNGSPAVGPLPVDYSVQVFGSRL